MIWWTDSIWYDIMVWYDLTIEWNTLGSATRIALTSVAAVAVAASGSSAGSCHVTCQAVWLGMKV